MSILYLEHFGLNKPPFQITPDTSYFFSGGRRGELLSALLHVAAHDEGISTVVAEVGSGKTQLARQMLAGLPPDVTTIYLSNPCFSREEILSAIGRDLGMGEMPASIEAKIAALHQELLRRHANGERVLLVIDEAHAMPAESLEEIRLLSNLETGQHKLVNILLFGQPELDEILAHHRLRQMRDRLIHRFAISPFSHQDARDYLNHRLHVAGWKGNEIFTNGAVRQIMKASGGRARRLNLLGDKSLLAAYAEQSPIVTRKHVRNACKEFEPRRGNPLLAIFSRHRKAHFPSQAPATRFSWPQLLALGLLIVPITIGLTLWLNRTPHPLETATPTRPADGTHPTSIPAPASSESQAPHKKETPRLTTPNTKP